MAYEQKDPLGWLLSCREALEQEGVVPAVSTTFSTEGRVYARRGNALPEEPQVRKNRGFPRFYFTVTTSRTTSHRSDGPRAAKEPDREHKDRADESENAVDGDSHQAERQRQQPDERIKHQSQQRERPAQDEQDEPEKESSHGNLVWERSTLTDILIAKLPPFIPNYDDEA